MSMYHTFRELLLPLSTSEAHTQLSFQPTALSLLDVSLVILIFLFRSLLHSIGLYPTKEASNDSSELPPFTLSMPLQMSNKHLSQYTSAVKHQESEDVEINNPQLMLFLSSITEPAMLLLLAKRGCPIRPLGSVNVRNRFELLRTDGTPAPLFSAKDALVTASLHKEPRRAKRGLEYDVETTLSIPDPKTGEQVPVFRQVFTMLQFMKIKEIIPKAAERNTEWTSSSAKLPVDVGFSEPSSWAAICKDYNPIHISTLAARVYGFSGKLAHGNHVVAKSLHVIGSKSRDSAKVLLKMSMPVWMEVEFRRPMIVPAKLELRVIQGAEEEKDTIAEFEVAQGGKVCVKGALGRL